jgi:hypothetical protein
MVATACAGILAGALARSRGALIAAVSNIPSAAVACFLLYYLSGSPALSYGDRTLTNHTGMIVCTALLIPLTTYFAYVCGEVGARIQQELPANTVLGIWGYHWAWLVVPMYIYVVAGLAPIMNLLKFDFLHANDSFLSGVLGLVLLVTAIASFAPLAWVYRSLTIPTTSFGARTRRACVNGSVLTLGFLCVWGVQVVSHKLLGTMASFWSQR